jgi:hypothetical protein
MNEAPDIYEFLGLGHSHHELADIVWFPCFINLYGVFIEDLHNDEKKRM